MYCVVMPLITCLDAARAQFVIVPYLLASPGIPALIDEMFLETHNNRSFATVNGTSATPEDQMALVKSLRNAGVYAHQWH